MQVLLGRLETVGVLAVGSTAAGTVLRGVSLLAPHGGWVFWTMVLAGNGEGWEVGASARNS